MSENASLPPVADDEKLARFLLFSGSIRKSNQTVKPDAFIPHPHPNLSVTRHVGLSEGEIWEIGIAVAKQRPATLHGCADIAASVVTKQQLNILPTATPKNHANITGWPADKPSQKMIAQELAAAATFVPTPNLHG